MARLGRLSEAVSAALQARALRTVAHWYEGFLAEMSTTAAEDEDLLASPLSPNMELAVRYRLQLKQVVQAAVEQILDHAAVL